jgi:GNAT superfamily N-acetyltransferase
MKATCRKARWRDVGQLLKLDTVAQHSFKRKAEIKRWVALHHCHVATVQGQIVGYAALSKTFFHMDFIEMLMVGTGHRRVGVATALLSYLSAKCKSRKLWTSTNRSNKPMQRLLKKEGFVRSGIVQNIDPGDPELVFVKLTP